MEGIENDQGEREMEVESLMVFCQMTLSSVVASNSFSLPQGKNNLLFCKSRFYFVKVVRGGILYGENMPTLPKPNRPCFYLKVQTGTNIQ